MRGSWGLEMKPARLCAAVYALGLALSHTHAVGLANAQADTRQCVQAGDRKSDSVTSDCKTQKDASQAQTDENVRNEEVSTDIKAVKACLDPPRDKKRRLSESETHYDDRYDCIGVILRNCTKEPSDESSSAHASMCAERESKAWDFILNENYQEKLKQLQAGDDYDEDVKKRQVEALRTAQRLWVQFRDAEVERIDTGSHGAGGLWTAYNDEFAQMDMTAKRAIDLK